jgi:hypothetical protein
MNMARKAFCWKTTSLLLFNSLRGCYWGRFRSWYRERWNHAGQTEEEGRAKPELALAANIPAMGMDDMLGDRQP